MKSLNHTIEKIQYSDVVNRNVPFDILSLQELYHRYKDHTIDLFSPHRIEFNALIIITEGKGQHHVDYERYELEDGVILPIAKGQVHVFDKRLEVSGHLITFNDPFIFRGTSEENLFHFFHLYHSPIINLLPESLQNLTPTLSSLKATLTSTDDYLKEGLLKVIFITLLIQIKRLSKGQIVNLPAQRVKDFIQFKNLIKEKYHESHNAKDYARHIGVSYKYLNDICKECSGKTAKSFINDWLLLEAKRNITEGKYTQKEISFKMGFDDPSNFTRFFKKFTDSTPREFKASIVSTYPVTH